MYLLHDIKTLVLVQGHNIQKMTSISASMATAKFNQLRLMRYTEDNEETCGNHLDYLQDIEGVIWYEHIEHCDLAFFDSRVSKGGPQCSQLAT